MGPRTASPLPIFSFRQHMAVQGFKRHDLFHSHIPLNSLFPLSNVYQKNHDTFMVMGHVFGKRNNDIRSPKIRFSYLVNKAAVLAISLMAGSVAMVVLLLPTSGNAD